MNYPQQSAQGLASLGRGNDSMLVHMTPREVQGLPTPFRMVRPESPQG